MTTTTPSTISLADLAAILREQRTRWMALYSDKEHVAPHDAVYDTLDGVIGAVVARQGLVFESSVAFRLLAAHHKCYAPTCNCSSH